MKRQKKTKKANRETWDWKLFIARCGSLHPKVCNGQQFEIEGRKKEYVGFGVIDLGPADGTEILVTS